MYNYYIKVGISFGMFFFDVNDLDVFLIYIYSIGCFEFDIEKNIGEFILVVDYDFDKFINLFNVMCVVMVLDGDFIGIVNVVIIINDVNDNVLFFGFLLYIFYVF